MEKTSLPKSVEGADDGIAFYFLVMKADQHREQFTLQEVRDFFIDDRSYMEMTREKIGRTPEPQTIIEDPVVFFRDVRPDLKASNKLSENAEGLTVYVLIPGIRLATGASGRVTARFGWGNAMEDFTFAFVVPALAGKNQDSFR